MARIYYDFRPGFSSDLYFSACIYAVFLGPAEFADGAGIRGVTGFLIHSALPAAILAAITMKIGNMLGTKLKSTGAFANTGLISFRTRTVLLLGSAAFWLARLLA